MKSTSIPAGEAAHLLQYRRAEDFLTGSLQELFFHILYIGHYVCKQTFHIQRRGMEAYVLLLTLGGEGWLRYQEREYRLSPGTVTLIEGRQIHEYGATEEGWNFQFLHFDGAMSREYLGYITGRLGPVFQLHPKIFLDTQARLEELLQLSEREEPLDYAVVSASVYALLSAFLSIENTVDLEQRSISAVLQAASYIVENQDRNLSTQEIADAVHLSRSYMSELFTKIHGVPPHEYLTRCRLSRAADRLRNGHASVTEIAEDSGFRDLFAFSRVFKKYYGVSPSQWRKQGE